MKTRILKLLVLLISLSFVSCDSLEECVKSTGPMVSREIPTEPFYSVTVRKGIALVVTQAVEYSVTVVSGENLIDEIDVKFTGGALVLTDNTTCNWTRDYGQTTVYVSAPNLTHINSKTQLDITSNGTLTYPSLVLISVDLSDGAGTGDFHLDVDNESLEVQSNNVSGFYLSGHTNQLTASFYEGNGVLKARELTAENISIFHRGSNNMFVKPVNGISGDIFSTGNVFCWPQPPTVEVERHYQGRLIFE